MGLNARQSKAPREIVLPENGNHVCRCYSVVDVGSHTRTSKYGVLTNREIRITFELPNEMHVFDEDKGAQPLVVSKTYTFSFGDKANLKKDLDNWLGRKITPKTDFDLESILGHTGMILVTRKVSENSGNPYAAISAITPLMKGMTVPPAINPLVYYDVSMGMNAVFHSLPEFLRDKILECEEWKGEDAVSTVSTSTEEENTDIPF